MRLSPIVPFNLQNYALGVTAISFLQYLTATLIGIAPGIAIYVYFGIFGKGLKRGPSVLEGCCSASACWRPSLSRS